MMVSKAKPTDSTPSASLNLRQRMVGVMANAQGIAKTKKKNGMKYDYVSHDDVTEEMKPLLVLWGICSTSSVVEYSHEGNKCTVLLERTFYNMDDLVEEPMVVRGLGYGVDNQDKGPGKAISYADKNIFLKCFCLGTGEENEVDANQNAIAKASPVEFASLMKYLDWHAITVDQADKALKSFGWAVTDMLSSSKLNAIIANDKFAVKVKNLGN